MLLLIKNPPTNEETRVQHLFCDYIVFYGRDWSNKLLICRTIEMTLRDILDDLNNSILN